MLRDRCLSCPSILTLVYCGETAGWIKITLGAEEGLGPGYIVLGGDPAAPKGAEHHHFSVHVCCCETVAHLSNC